MVWRRERVLHHQNDSRDISTPVRLSFSSRFSRFRSRAQIQPSDMLWGTPNSRCITNHSRTFLILATFHDALTFRPCKKEIFRLQCDQRLTRPLADVTNSHLPSWKGQNRIPREARSYVAPYIKFLVRNPRQVAISFHQKNPDVREQQGIPGTQGGTHTPFGPLSSPWSYEKIASTPLSEEISLVICMIKWANQIPCWKTRWRFRGSSAMGKVSRKLKSQFQPASQPSKWSTQDIKTTRTVPISQATSAEMEWSSRPLRDHGRPLMRWRQATRTVQSRVSHPGPAFNNPGRGSELFTCTWSFGPQVLASFPFTAQRGSDSFWLIPQNPILFSSPLQALLTVTLTVTLSDFSPAIHLNSSKIRGAACSRPELTLSWTHLLCHHRRFVHTGNVASVASSFSLRLSPHIT